jgi:hypothetical protein
MKSALLLVLLAWSCAAQPLRVFSEFARINAEGNVTAPESPREILSPAIARNAFTSFQVVVQLPPEKHFDLYIGQNPENAVRVTLYRESGNRLEPVAQPVRGMGTAVLWMDVWAERSAPVERIKVEPQLNVDDDWVIYPMEVRVMDAVVPEVAKSENAAPPFLLMKNFLCGTRSEASYDNDIARMQSRNGHQDLTLARGAPKADLQKLFGTCEAAPSPDPEWYLRIRDYLFRLR